MSYWHQQMVEGDEFWISCKWLTALRKASQSQVIKCSAPSTICWRQCDIQIDELCCVVQIVRGSYNPNRHNHAQYKDMLIFLRVWAYTWNEMVYVEFVEFVKFDNSALLQSKPSCPWLKAAKYDYLFTVMTTLYYIQCAKCYFYSVIIL